MSNIRNFNINVTMEERWIPYFVSFLTRMESYGNAGHSGLIGFYADGDGDFRPKFIFDEFDKNDLKVMHRDPIVEEDDPDLEYYDAG